MEYCSVATEDEVLMPAVMWMNLESMILSESSQEPTYCRVPFTRDGQDSRICRERKLILVCLGLEGAWKSNGGGDCQWMGASGGD